MHVGIYGGSFNPIHIGHTSLAKSLLSQRLVDEVWLLVSPLNPLKQQASNDIAPYEDRLHMAELACKETESLQVSDFESTLSIPSYTITTLNELSQAYPEHQFTLIIGADNWQRFGNWYKSDEILKNYSIIIYRRPGCNIDEESIAKIPTVKLATTPLYDISSTEIRNHYSKNKLLSPYNKSISTWLDPMVKEYIEQKGLYIPPKK